MSTSSQSYESNYVKDYVKAFQGPVAEIILVPSVVYGGPDVEPYDGGTPEPYIGPISYTGLSTFYEGLSGYQSTSSVNYGKTWYPTSSATYESYMRRSMFEPLKLGGDSYFGGPLVIYSSAPAGELDYGTDPTSEQYQGLTEYTSVAGYRSTSTQDYLKDYQSTSSQDYIKLRARLYQTLCGCQLSEYVISDLHWGLHCKSSTRVPRD